MFLQGKDPTKLLIQIFKFMAVFSF